MTLALGLYCAGLLLLWTFAGSGLISRVLNAVGRKSIDSWKSPRAARVTGRLLQRTGADASSRLQGHVIELFASHRLGDLHAAIRSADVILARAARIPCVIANIMICDYVTCGRYRVAVRTANRTMGFEGDLRSWGLVQVNAAEALYNLGCHKAARRRLARAEALVGASDSLVHSGARLNRAWMLGLENDGAPALEIAGSVTPAELPPEYHAEIEYTRALALAALGRFDEARSAAEDGHAKAQRPSSVRNGLFLRGTIEHRAGAWEKAVALFEEGSRHPYRDQGGDALLAWAEALEKLGRGAEAGEIHHLVIERDPESVAARKVRRILRADR